MSPATVKRGVFYMNRDRRETWERVMTIAHENRGEAEARDLMAKAAMLALERFAQIKSTGLDP